MSQIPAFCKVTGSKAVNLLLKNLAISKLSTGETPFSDVGNQLFYYVCKEYTRMPTWTQRALLRPEDDEAIEKAQRERILSTLLNCYGIEIYDSERLDNRELARILAFTLVSALNLRYPNLSTTSVRKSHLDGMQMMRDVANFCERGYAKRRGINCWK